MFKTFDGQEVEDGWYTAQYKTEREVVWIYKGRLYTGPWSTNDDDLFVMELDDYPNKHHDFKRIELNNVP